MKLERNITNYTVQESAPLKKGLKLARTNKIRTIFVVDVQGKLQGVVSSGDLGEWLLNQKELNIEEPIINVANTHFVYANQHMDASLVQSMFRPRIDAIPILDNTGCLVSIAFNKLPSLPIGDTVVSDESPCYVIAEIGNNHNGSLDLAFRLIDAAKNAGASCAKFQMRQLNHLYKGSSDGGFESEDLGTQYVIGLLKKYSLSNDNLFRAFDYCRKVGITPLCTPWEEESLTLLEGYGMSAYKVASADLTNHIFLEKLCATKKPLIISTGMSTNDEVIKTIRLLDIHSASFALLHCNSTYPTPFKDVNLPYLKRLKDMSQAIVGYSGHERGISIPLAAVSMGAKIVEKHLTLDKGMEGNDHKVSLLPEEFEAMVRGIREIEEASIDSKYRRITQGELMNRETLAKSLVTARKLKSGDVISSGDVSIRSPGKGLQPIYRDQLMGRVLQRDMEKDEFFYLSDLVDKPTCKLDFSFKRKWGIPVRYHDMDQLIAIKKPDLVEFHFSYQDLSLNPDRYLEKREMEFVVHAPELFEGDHILDLCSVDDRYRRRSIEELQKVIDHTRKLLIYFSNREKPLIIVNVGGFSTEGWLSAGEKKGRYRILTDSLNKLDRSDVELIPQTMPPFPWHFGGQQYHNLFVEPDETVEFCRESNMRLCLDVSHSKLAANHYGFSFRSYLEKVAPYAAHCHLVDALGDDGEGLQIGDGEIDFGELAEVLDRCAPDASFIPEIWQGHKNRGEGLWIALRKLEQYL